MGGLLWGEVRDLFDPDVMGAPPDLQVTGASAADWQALLDLVEESGWRSRYAEDGTTVPSVPRAEEALSRPVDTGPELRVWPADGLQAIFRFCTPEEIDFDVDLRELQGQERLDLFCDFLSAIGRRLGRPVLMGPEGSPGRPVLGYDPGLDRVVRLPEPPDG
ncbi:hypothetical protein [Nocardiopsis composta]|uniref:Uncharacterized protein n=1 Tax=Nocardiopsis composta TaxID=157465 RepID=A0A7W8QIK5_9ACTN|nr:hypothetical protein [Nocardiopsis composta]MBB5431162.1 hypothetical protein [Nocardiopsis composta]